MQQRVALARALVIAPPLLLLDETLSALDAAIRDALRTELRRLQRQLNVTLIYVTHDQAEAMALSDTIVVMEKGKVSQVGSPATSTTNPLTRFTAAFVGASSRRETTLESANGHPAIRWANVLLPVTTVADLPIGHPIIASWRSEDATLTIQNDATQHALTGTIELITFLGPITRFDILLAGDPDPVMVDLAFNEARDLAPGVPVALAVPPDAIRLYT